MAYFPFMVEIEDKNCLVVGGGRIALHKVSILHNFGVHIKVISREICTEIKEMSDVTVVERDFLDSDIQGMYFVVAATDDEDLNAHISNLCRQCDILVNAVDMKEACSFIFPAIIQEGDLLISISTGGQSPAAAAYVKQKIKKQIPEYYGEMIELLGEYRDFILEHVDTAAARKEIFHQLLKYADTHNGGIPKEMVKQTMERIVKKHE